MESAGEDISVKPITGQPLSSKGRAESIPDVQVPDRENSKSFSVIICLLKLRVVVDYIVTSLLECFVVVFLVWRVFTGNELFGSAAGKR